MTIYMPIFVAKRFKVTVLLNAFLNVCALVVLLYFINNKSVNYEISIRILGMFLTSLAWIIVNLFFGILFFLRRQRDTNYKALQILVGIHFKLAAGLVCIGLITLIITTKFVILEIMGMVAAFFIPFIMLVIVYKLPKKNITIIFE